MTKKSRRTRAKQGTGRITKTVAQKPVITSDVKGEVKASASVGSTSSSSTSVNRYRYVVPELRRIGIIAGSLIVILIILTFVLG